MAFTYVASSNFGLGALGFAFYSLTLVRNWKLEDARRFGQLALKLDEERPAPEWRGKLYLTLAVGPAFVTESVSNAFELLKKAALKGIETGDVEVRA